MGYWQFYWYTESREDLFLQLRCSLTLSLFLSISLFLSNSKKEEIPSSFFTKKIFGRQHRDHLSRARVECTFFSISIRNNVVTFLNLRNNRGGELQTRELTETVAKNRKEEEDTNRSSRRGLIIFFYVTDS